MKDAPGLINKIINTARLFIGVTAFVGGIHLTEHYVNLPISMFASWGVVFILAFFGVQQMFLGLDEVLAYSNSDYKEVV